MKQFLLFVLIFSGFIAVGQNKTKKVLTTKGQKIEAVSTNESTIDMGMGMLIKNNSVSNSVLEVTAENEATYTLTNTVMKIKATIEAMGKTHEFDSEKPGDRESEIGKSMSEVLGKPVTLTIDKYSGVSLVTKNIAPDTEMDPMSDMMESLGGAGSDVSVSGAFIVVPEGKKAGDTWIITDSTAVSKSNTVYTLNSISNNIATVSFVKTSTIHNSMDVQGNPMDISLNSKTSGEATTDVVTGLVSKSTINIDIDGNMDIMGQTMPLSGKTRAQNSYTLVK